MTGAPIKPEALWTMMKQLKERISRLRGSGCITNVNEQQKLEFLIKTKKWNPYCILHSAITSDSDYLPDYALKKKARWSMNSKQPSRYIKTRMGDELKQKILVHSGIIHADEIKRRPSILVCPRCDDVNAIDNQVCSKCAYPLSPVAYEEIRSAEDTKFKVLEEKYQQGLRVLEGKIGEEKFRVNRLISILLKEGKDGVTAFTKKGFDRLANGESRDITFATIDCEYNDPMVFNASAKDILVVRKEIEKNTNSNL